MARSQATLIGTPQLARRPRVGEPSEGWHAYACGSRSNRGLRCQTLSAKSGNFVEAGPTLVRASSSAHTPLRNDGAQAARRPAVSALPVSRLGVPAEATALRGELNRARHGEQDGEQRPGVPQAQSDWHSADARGRRRDRSGERGDALLPREQAPVDRPLPAGSCRPSTYATQGSNPELAGFARGHRGPTRHSAPVHTDRSATHTFGPRLGQALTPSCIGTTMAPG